MLKKWSVVIAVHVLIEELVPTVLHKTVLVDTRVCADCIGHGCIYYQNGLLR